MKELQPRHQEKLVVVSLLAALLVVYLQVGGHGFISYDDGEYVYANPHLRDGFTPTSLRWAFTAFHSCNWHPLTWLSHLLDVQLFGMNPAGHHLMNVALHGAATLLLYFLLLRLTGRLWPSAAVSAFFALHPLHVESVAWVAERKDVLSACLGLLTLHAYARYSGKRGLGRYLVVFVTFALGLMAKPMLVTLPLVMLLLDYWPLGRFRDARSPLPPVVNLVVEKLPLFLLVAASSLLTLMAQKAALRPLGIVSLGSRLANAVVACVWYIGKTFVPLDLAVFYPFQAGLPRWQWVGSLILVAAVTAVAAWQRRRRPYLFVGWFWYLVTLVPVIGIVQVGWQAVADRYSYLPLIGIFIVLVWGTADLCLTLRYRSAILTSAAAAALSFCAVTSYRQVSFWRDSATLFSHALASTSNNYIAHLRLGDELEGAGKTAEAIAHYEAALAAAPSFSDACFSLGSALRRTGRNEEALENFEAVLVIDPATKLAHYNIGSILYGLGRRDEAIGHFEEEIAVNPAFVDAYNNLAIALADKGDLDRAAYYFEYALKLDPRYDQARKNLERVRQLQQR